MGSQTDFEIMSQAAVCLEIFGIPYDMQVVSAHRTPEKMVEFARSAADHYSVIIAGAGAAAHLPGMVASMTTLPVIGVPVQVNNLMGLDALLSIVQMPKGIPVATVAIDNAFNAGILAARICGVQDEKIRARLVVYQGEQQDKVAAMNNSLRAAMKKKNSPQKSKSKKTSRSTKPRPS